jgi:hypothetical protein
VEATPPARHRTKERIVTARFNRTTAVILVTTALAFTLASTAGAGKGGKVAKVVAQGALTNGGKTAHVKVNVTTPSKLTYTVEVTPAQKVSVYTSIVCALGSGNGNGSQDYQDGSYPTTFAFRARAPLTRQILLPYPHPKYCLVEVYSNLSKTGKQTLDLLQS